MLKKIFITGLMNILPTLLVIAILLIAYNFLTQNLGAPINNLIKKQLAGNWKHVAINYLNIDETLYQTVKFETYEELVKRVQSSSLSFHDAKINLENAKAKFTEQATDFIQKKETSSDPEYIKFLEEKIAKIREASGLKELEKNLQKENIKLKQDIVRENEIRLSKQKFIEDTPKKLKESIDKKYPDVIGLFIALLIIFFIGVIITTVAGKSLKHYWERTLSSLPLVKMIYPYAKQLTEFIFNENKTLEFKSVVIVEYPRKGIYSMGFPTGEFNVPELNKNKMTVFIPSSPTPVTGYTIIVDTSDVIQISMTVEEAVRFCITGGVIKPDLFKNGLGLLEDKKKI